MIFGRYHCQWWSGRHKRKGRFENREFDTIPCSAKRLGANSAIADAESCACEFQQRVPICRIYQH